MLELTTNELLDYVKAHAGETIEATRYYAIGGLRGTHWFHYWKSRFYHEGIDSERVCTSRRRLLADYDLVKWYVEEERLAVGE